MASESLEQLREERDQARAKQREMHRREQLAFRRAYRHLLNRTGGRGNWSGLLCYSRMLRADLEKAKSEIRELRAAYRGLIQGLSREFSCWAGPQRTESKGRCDNWFVSGPCGRDREGGGQCESCLLDRIEDIVNAAIEDDNSMKKSHDGGNP